MHHRTSLTHFDTFSLFLWWYRRDKKSQRRHFLRSFMKYEPHFPKYWGSGVTDLTAASNHSCSPRLEREQLLNRFLLSRFSERICQKTSPKRGLHKSSRWCFLPVSCSSCPEEEEEEEEGGCVQERTAGTETFMSIRDQFRALHPLHPLTGFLLWVCATGAVRQEAVSSLTVDPPHNTTAARLNRTTVRTSYDGQDLMTCAWSETFFSSTGVQHRKLPVVLLTTKVMWPGAA